MNTLNLSGLLRRSLALATLAALAALPSGAALAQTAPKSIVAEHVPAFPAFNQWVTTFVRVQPEPLLAPVQAVPFSLMTVMTVTPAPTYEPRPVILGLPDLPLIGTGATRAARGWAAGLNYQGLHMRMVVLNAQGQQNELRSMGSPLRQGEYFKIRISATFDAVAEVDQVLGEVWQGRRTGQVYPEAGLSVHMRAGESVDLPLGVNEYFLMNQPADERLVVSVRHAKALGAARSEQPAYRQDGKSGSNYLQLVPPGKYPAVEQLISPTR